MMGCLIKGGSGYKEARAGRWRGEGLKESKIHGLKGFRAQGLYKGSRKLGQVFEYH